MTKHVMMYTYCCVWPSEQVILLNHNVECTWLWLCHLLKRNHFSYYTWNVPITMMCLCLCLCVLCERTRACIHYTNTHNWFICNLTHNLCVIIFVNRKKIVIRHLNLPWIRRVRDVYNERVSTLTTEEVKKKKTAQSTLTKMSCFSRKTKHRGAKKKIEKNNYTLILKFSVQFLCEFCTTIEGKTHLFLFLLFSSISIINIVLHYMERMYCNEINKCCVRFWNVRACFRFMRGPEKWAPHSENEKRKPVKTNEIMSVLHVKSAYGEYNDTC